MRDLFENVVMFSFVAVILGLIVPVSIMAWREVLKGRK